MASDWQIQQVAHLIKQGGVIAYPTEGVWGLGCNPWDEQATLKVLELKARPVEKGLILIASTIEQFDFILHDLPKEQFAKLQQSWPGPFTWLVPHQDRVPDWITGTHATVALRVTNHPIVKALCDLTGPIVSTSANLAGQPSAQNRLMVEKYFHGQLDAVLNGELGKERKSSQITDLVTGKIIR